MRLPNIMSYRTKSLLLLFVLFCSFASLSSLNLSSTPPPGDYEWQKLISNDFVEISYRYQHCDLPAEGMNNEYVLLRIENKVSSELTVEWDIEYWYNDKCIGCSENSSENHIIINLLPGETLEGDCTKFRDRSLTILSKMLHIKSSSVLTDFKLNSLTTSVINH
jgi:hypothetical protein